MEFPKPRKRPSINGWHLSREALAGDPTPSQIAILDETIVSLLREMDERSGQIFLLILQGWTTEEIGNEVQCSERTARRVLNRVHRRLEELRDGEEVEGGG